MRDKAFLRGKLDPRLRGAWNFGPCHLTVFRAALAFEILRAVLKDCVTPTRKLFLRLNKITTCQASSFQVPIPTMVYRFAIRTWLLEPEPEH